MKTVILNHPFNWRILRCCIW